MTRQVHVMVPFDAGDVPFVVQGLDRRTWTQLLHEHPSTDPRWRFDVDSLAPELLRLCVVEPELSPVHAAALADDTDVGGELIDVCLRLSDPGALDASLTWARRRLETDARLAAEVGAAVRMGIPHAAFVGWPDASQDLALAWIAGQAAVCPGCGVPEADMRRPDAWEVDLSPSRDCWHCGTLARAVESIPEDERYHVHPRLVRPEAG